MVVDEALGYPVACLLEIGGGGAVAPFDAFLFVVFVLMTVGALLLLVPYLHSLEK